MLKSSGARAEKRKKTKIINQIQEPGPYRGHHQYEGPPEKQFRRDKFLDFYEMR